jgi:hypothetical protein
MLQYFQKINKKIPQKVEKTPPKIVQKYSILFLHYYPELPKWTIKMWLIDQLFIKRVYVCRPYFMGQGKPHNSVKKRDTLHR